MELLGAYLDAKRSEDIARLRRVVALRAMMATGMIQRRVATELGVSQQAVSQQLKSAPDLDALHPEVLLEAAAPVVRALAEARGYTRLAVFGSVARHEAQDGSDIDLLVAAPEGISSFDFLRFQQLVEEVLGRAIDLVAYGGLQPGLDGDIRRDAVLL